jgi:hypothetical protein
MVHLALGVLLRETGSHGGISPGLLREMQADRRFPGIERL